MAKKWNLWRKNEDDTPGDATQHETGRKYQSLWDEPEDFETEDTGVFGGYGYTGSVYEDTRDSSYRYEDTIDDSSDHWYRRSGFRYGRHVDYSPSQLFRSTFTSRYYTSDDNEAKNKAIRALRLLTRNANTITDTGTKGTYAVQYSSGADSNGVSEKLNDDKQRIVYVSPDELLATTTTAEEDNVVDALTGFVLLRVQMAQTLAQGVIETLNGTNIQHLSLRIGKSLLDDKRKIGDIPAEELTKIAASATDFYLGGILAKSMLMRLARRGVVENWGGFAPYFIRHAKKFNATRETLEKAELSIESLVGRIAYNMLDDETPFELPPVVVETINKWLGVSVDPENLLPICVELVLDLRAQLAATGEKVSDAAGIEAAIDEMLQELAKKNRDVASEKSALTDYLENVAGAFFDTCCERNVRSTELGDLRDVERTKRDQLSANKSAEQLARRVEKHMKELLEQLAKPEATPIDKFAAFSSAVNDMLYDISARPKAAKALDSGKIEATRDELSKLHRSVCEEHSKGIGLDPKEIEKLKDTVKDFVANIKEAVEETAESTEKALEAQIEAAKKCVNGLKEKMAELGSRMREAYAKAIEAPPHPTVSEEMRRVACDMLANSVAAVPNATDQLDAAITELNGLLDRLARSRSAGGVDKVSADLAKIIENIQRSSVVNGAVADYYQYYAIPQFRSMGSGLAGALPSDDREEAIAQAVNTALNVKELSSRELVSLAINEFFKEQEHTNGLTDYTPEEIAELYRQQPEHATTIKQILAALMEFSTPAKEAEATDPKRIGKACAEKLELQHENNAAVDNELFGKRIAVKTKILDGDAIGKANDEARNAAEEEYVAYLSGGSKNATKPTVRTEKETTVRRDDYGRVITNGGASIVKTVCSKYRSFIERIRNALQFQAGRRTEEQFGLQSGDLDEGGLYKLNYDCEHIWSRKTTSKLPDVAVGILVDQSGSMSGPKIEQARTICIILAEALRKIPGVRLYVYGHTANERHGADLTIFEHYTPATAANIAQLGNIRAHTNNYDGFAIKDVAKRLMQDSAKKKYLFVIADGLPAGAGYGGNEAEKHVTSVCKFIRERMKIGLYAFAVGISDHQRPTFKRQYGENNTVFVNNVMKCLPQIVRFLRNTLQKEKKLVSEID